MARRQILNRCEGTYLFGPVLPATTDPMEAFVGGKPALVLFSGSEYGQLCGIQRVDVLVPDDSPTGDAVPIRLGIPTPVVSATPWYWAQDGVTIAIK